MLFKRHSGGVYHEDHAVFPPFRRGKPARHQMTQKPLARPFIVSGKIFLPREGKHRLHKRFDPLPVKGTTLQRKHFVRAALVHTEDDLPLRRTERQSDLVAVAVLRPADDLQLRQNESRVFLKQGADVCFFDGKLLLI